MALDALKPSDNSLVRTWAGIIRETRTRINYLESLFQEHILGVAVYRPTEVTTPTHDLAAGETFVKANCGLGGIVITIDPADLNPGLIYVIKKTDGTLNIVTVQLITDKYINDTETQMTITLQHEVLRFISDGVGLHTC